MRRVRRRHNRKGWEFLTPSAVQIVVYMLTFIVISPINGLFHVDVQTVNRPIPGEPVNLEIVVEPPLSMLSPIFGGIQDRDNVSDRKDTQSELPVTIDPIRIDPVSNENFSEHSHSLHHNGSDKKNTSTGHNLRRGVFGFEHPQQKSVQPGTKPATINIQLPGKLPFNPFNLFNMDTLKTLVQSVTENLSGSKKAYTTGFDDSVTIISSDDPEKPIPRAILSPENLNNDQSNNIISNDVQANNFKDTIPFIRLQPSVPIVPKPVPVQPQVNIPIKTEIAPYTEKSNHMKKFHHKNQPIYQGQPPLPSAMQNPALLTEESMINKQMETLNEVLTHEMSHKDQRISTTIAPLTFPFLPDLSALSQLFNWGEQGARTLAVCNACRVGFGLFVSRARSGGNLANLMELATFGCTFFRITSPEMCKGLVASFGPILHYMVMNRPSITAERFCGISLQSSGCTTTDPESHWKIDLSHYSVVPISIDPPATPRKGKQEQSSSVQRVEESRISKGAEERLPESLLPTPRRRNFMKFDPTVPKGIRTLKVLQLTDIHVDFDYQPGAMNDCDNEMCCHVANGKGPPGKRAGYYGDYKKCDLPFHAYMDALQHISTQHPDIDMIYLTGDFVPHNIWNTSVTRNAQVLVNASQYIHDFFPRAKVIPVIGNHESHPVNMFSPFGVPGEFSTDWLYATAARAWEGWLPKRSIHNFLHSGFYDVEVDPFFRIIVLNTNLCYGYNFWQSFEPRDPGGQLRWLARELQRSEDLGQFVHILGHVAPAEADCFTVWSQNFYEIINRYSNIVKAQFYGHTHFDEFKLYYHSYNRSQAINAVWLGASLTPYTNLNPGYKIFTVDGARGQQSTWDILDHETWIYNLTEANLNPHIPPRWFRLYKATEAFEIADVSPASLSSFVHRMSSNVTAFNIYHRLYHKATDVALEEGCDNLCRKQILCSMVTPHFGEHKMCLQLQSNVDGIILPSSVFNVGGDSPLRAIGTRSSTDSPIQRVLSFGRSLLRALGR